MSLGRGLGDDEVPRDYQYRSEIHFVDELPKTVSGKIRLVDELPKTVSGKIRRVELRGRLLDGRLPQGGA